MGCWPNIYTWLSDPLKSLKQIYPVLTDITEKTKNLADNIKNDSNPDNELVKIIDQVMTMAGVEQIKMERGDYTPVS